jgi:hypothetical protein
MRTRKPNADPRNARPAAKPRKPKRRAVTARQVRAPSVSTRQIMKLVCEAKAEERATRDPMLAYSVRQRLDQRLSALAESIADKRLASGDDLLNLALAGWYANGARLALVKAVLRAGGVDPGSPHRKVRGRAPVSRR